MGNSPALPMRSQTFLRNARQQTAPRFRECRDTLCLQLRRERFIDNAFASELFKYIVGIATVERQRRTKITMVGKRK